MQEPTDSPHPRAAESLAKWNGLSPEDREGMLLASEARTLGSRGEKHGNDVGVVLVRPVVDESAAGGGRLWQVVSWGCARTLTNTNQGKQQQEGDNDDTSCGENAIENGTIATENATDASDAAASVQKKRKPQRGGDQKIDIHAEADAVAYASRFGIKLEGCHAYVTRSPCNKCLPILVAAGVSVIKYSDAVAKHTSPDSAAQMKKIATINRVALTENVPCLPPEISKHKLWLEGKETRLFPRDEIWKQHDLCAGVEEVME
jgi:deoxycytidylate deaminase|tara:strand:+ start:2984 stop:3766 length:783 start_codon:yes stop_codon:yes gene_type:complete